jgi:hypothetical protein
MLRSFNAKRYLLSVPTMSETAPMRVAELFLGSHHQRGPEI